VDQTQQVDIATLLRSIAGQLEQDEGRINDIGAASHRGDHGSNMAQAFSIAASAAQDSRSDDAGEQLAAAAQAMRQAHLGKSTGYYASGLEQAARQFQGKTAIQAADFGPLLQAIFQGIERANPSQRGRGGMLDALGPAANAYVGASHQGGGNAQDLLGALLAAAQGAVGTRDDRGTVDPGAASATSLLGGLVKAALPMLAGMAASSMSSGRSNQSNNTDMIDMLGGLLGSQSTGDRQSDVPAQVDIGDMLTGLLGGTGGSNKQNPSGSDPLGGLGGILGSIMGGSDGNQSRDQSV
jgi:phosphoenolpyruvate---glycerone phosphotransferase subunit DhaL